MVIVGLIIALLPAVICAVVLAAIRAWRPGCETCLRWAVPFAVAAGFVAAQTMIDGVPRVPPIEASGWFSIVTMVLAVLAIAIRPRVSSTVWGLVCLLAALAIVIVIVHPLVGEFWSWPEAIGWVIGMTAVAGSGAWLVDRRASPGPGAPAVLLIAATGVAVGLALCGSARYGQLAGAIASVMAPLILLGLIRRDTRLLDGAAWVAYLVLAMLVVAGVAYVDVPVFVGLLVAVAPLGMLAGDVPRLAPLAFWKRDSVRVVVTIAIVSLALAVAAAAATSSAPY
ncbi:MAG: hypothetical protein ACAI38_09205 [Myxococcota bacterium]|nr:hypothetical protein [Myxococcota bacterium]